MPTPTTFYTDNLAYINSVCVAYVGENVVALAHAITPAAFMLLGFYVIVWGYASLRGMIEQPLTDMLARLVKITLIFSIAIGVANYNTVIVNLFVDGPDQLTQAMANAKTPSGMAAGLDILFDHGFAVGKQFWGKAGILHGDFGMYIAALVVFLITVAVTAYAFFLIVLAKVALSILLALGPLFILSLLFQSTQNYFSSWVQQLSNYFLVPVLVVAVNLLVLTLFSRAADSAMTSTADIDQVFPFMALGLVALLALGSVLSMASGLAGGVSLSSFGMGRMASRAGLKLASNVAEGMGKAGVAGAKMVARPAWNAYQNRNKNSLTNKE